MSDEDKSDTKSGGFYGVAGKCLEITLHKDSVTLKMSNSRSSQIKQAPSCHYCIESEDYGRGDDAEDTYQSPALALRE